MACREENYYEILDIPTNASPLEIRRAFQDMFELYQGDSLVSYSFFTEKERKDLLARLENAYFTLINEGQRNLYDGRLIDEGLMQEENRYRNAAKVPIPLYNRVNRFASPSRTTSGASGMPPPAAENTLVRETMQKGVLTGHDLRNIRTALDIPLEKIAQESKIKTATLRAIEDNTYDHLPPLPYLKGFIRLYARCLQLNEDNVVRAYLQHLDRLSS